jgi:hypothetical protein
MLDSDMLVNELELAIRSKRRGTSLKKGIVASQRPHTAGHTVDTLRALKFEVLKHPPYSPDLAPSDFHLFGPMKEHLRGQKFADDEVMETVQSRLKATPKSFFLAGIRNLVDRWTKYVAKRGGLCRKIRQTISTSTLVKKLL